jgi:hypothetical protein
MSVLRKLLAAFAALLLLTTFAACGDDDDDDDEAAEAVDEVEDVEDEATDDGAEEQAEVDDALAALCEDFNSSEGGDTTVEEVQASLDLAIAAQTAAETEEGADALQLLIDFTQFALDNDDGDGVITDAEVSAAAAEFPTLEDALAVVAEGCAGQGL